MTILVCGHRLNEMETALSYPQLKFLAAELVQQGFIFKEAAFLSEDPSLTVI